MKKIIITTEDLEQMLLDNGVHKQIAEDYVKLRFSDNNHNDAVTTITDMLSLLFIDKLATPGQHRHFVENYLEVKYDLH